MRRKILSYIIKIICKKTLKKSNMLVIWRKSDLIPFSLIIVLDPLAKKSVTPPAKNQIQFVVNGNSFLDLLLVQETITLSRL